MNDPHPKRLDGTPPEYLPRVAYTGSLSDLFGLSATVTDPRAYYYIADHLNTAQLLVDEQGGIVWQGEFKPFGGVDITVNRLENNFRCPGQYFDEETGLYYNWHRYYDPEIGRYISADPIGLDGGINLYGYVSNDPVNALDPWGLVWVTLSYDYHGRYNTVRGFFNRLANIISRGDDPSLAGADPQEYEGLRRDIIQEWQKDKDNPCRDSEFPLGTRRKITQEYIKQINPGPGEVIINNPDDIFYHTWEPLVGSPTYEKKINVKYENLYYLEQQDK